jgi:hypothetical protein
MGYRRVHSMDLLKAAGEDCLRNSTHGRSDISLLIHAGVYRTEFVSEPAIAALVAGELDINARIESLTGKRTLAFDVFNGAVGFLNACYVGAEMIRSNQFETAMIVAAEVDNNAELWPENALGIRVSNDVGSSRQWERRFWQLLVQVFYRGSGRLDDSYELAGWKGWSSVAKRFVH